MGYSVSFPLLLSCSELRTPNSLYLRLISSSKAAMGPSSAGGPAPTKMRRSSRAPTTIHSLDHDILCTMFSFLGIFDLVRCSIVCKSWSTIINKSKLLQVLYCKQLGSTRFSNTSTCSEKSMKLCLEELAMEHHSMSLQEGLININLWKGHSIRVNQCRMKMGLLLTGVGDKVMRLWSLENYKCMKEYSILDTAPLVDFDFDESKIVGLAGTRICIWRHNGKKVMFPSREGTFSKGLCMRYFDPEAVVGCEDGTIRVFDMYSRKCSQIIRTHVAPVTCLCLSDDQLIFSGSRFGNITISRLSSDQRVATLRSTGSAGIKTLCFNPRSHLVFAGSTAGYTHCWDIRTMRTLWEARVSPNVVYSLQHLRNDTSILVAGGIDGILRILNQNTGEVLSRCVMEGNMISGSSGNTYEVIERKRGRRLSEDTNIDSVPRVTRPPITCLAVGMKKVVTTHNSKYIRTWKFNSNDSF